MIDEYVYIDDEPVTMKEPDEIKEAFFVADYDISDVLTKWGRWARKEAYLKQQSAINIGNEPVEIKECCNDDEGLLIDGAMSALKKVGTYKAKDEHIVLKLYYYGLETVIDDTPMVVPQTIRDISKITGISRSSVDKIKASGESCIVGMLAMLRMLTP